VGDGSDVFNDSHDIVIVSELLLADIHGYRGRCAHREGIGPSLLDLWSDRQEISPRTEFCGACRQELSFRSIISWVHSHLGLRLITCGLQENLIPWVP
jgi:hypothetical protein